MKWAYHIKYKIKAACLLAVIMVIILLSNLSERHSISEIDDSMSSIVDDRLKPSTYIFEITKNLYQKRMLYDQHIHLSDAQLQTTLDRYNKAISLLVKDYETTVLTAEEQVQWVIFKNKLEEYNKIEDSWLHSLAANGDNKVSSIQASGHFDQMMKHLTNLSELQVGVGSTLQKSSHSAINSTLILSTLEISLLIVLALFTLIILSVSDQAIFKGHQNQALN